MTSEPKCDKAVLVQFGLTHSKL